MKELFVEEAQLGHVEIFGDEEDKRSGNLRTVQDSVEGRIVNTVNSAKLIKRTVFLPNSLLYNLLNGGWHGRDYYVQFFAEVNPQIRSLSRKNSGGKNGKQYQNFRFTVNMGIPERLRLLRTRLNLTQDEFAYKIGKSLRTIQKWESGQTVPNDKTLRLISHTFGVSYEWLKEGKGEMWERRGEDEVEELARMILARAQREGKEICMEQAKKLAKKLLKIVEMEIDMMGEEDMAG